MSKNSKIAVFSIGVILIGYFVYQFKNDAQSEQLENSKPTSVVSTKGVELGGQDGIEKKRLELTENNTSTSMVFKNGNTDIHIEFIRGLENVEVLSSELSKEEQAAVEKSVAKSILKDQNKSITDDEYKKLTEAEINDILGDSFYGGIEASYKIDTEKQIVKLSVDDAQEFVLQSNYSLPTGQPVYLTSSAHCCSGDGTDHSYSIVDFSRGVAVRIWFNDASIEKADIDRLSKIIGDFSKTAKFF